MTKERIIHVVGDVEASGQVPGLFDMISIGLTVLEPALDRSFYCEMAPLHDNFQQGAYDFTGVTREQHLAMPPPAIGMIAMFEWIAKLRCDRIIFWSDNNGFDYAFLNWYVWWMIGQHKGELPHREYRERALEILGMTDRTAKSPFGHTSRRINDVAAGLKGNLRATQEWKRGRVTAHTHRADEDAKGNAEALLALMTAYNQKPLWEA